MRYDLIWKKIDEEISKEEKTILDDIFKSDKTMSVQYDNSVKLDQILSAKFSHSMDASFMSKLKLAIVEELDLPSLRINYTPVFIFVVIAILLSVIVSVIPSINRGPDLDLSTFMPYITMITAICFGGMSLFGLDLVLKSKYKF